MTPTKQDLQEVVLTIVFAQLMIEQIDNLSFTPFFKNKVKKIAKNLQATLEPKVNLVFNDEAGDIAEASNQLVDVSRMCWKVSVALLNVDDLHYTGFTNDFKRLLEKYHLDEKLINELFEL